MQFVRLARLLGFCALPLFVAGCSSKPSRVEMEGFHPNTIGDAAIQQYDTDGDGALSKTELEKCPGILKALPLYDKNNDGKVAADEIAARVNVWIADKTASMNVSCDVTLDGQPLSGGKVEFIPEDFFGGSLHPAAGDLVDGNAIVFVDPSLLPPDQAALRGVHPGIYKVKITHPSTNIPDKYNNQTTLGQEVAMDNFDLQTLKFELESR